MLFPVVSPREGGRAGPASQGLSSPGPADLREIRGSPGVSLHRRDARGASRCVHPHSAGAPCGAGGRETREGSPRARPGRPVRAVPPITGFSRSVVAGRLSRFHRSARPTERHLMLVLDLSQRRFYQQSLSTSDVETLSNAVGLWKRAEVAVRERDTRTGPNRAASRGPDAGRGRGSVARRRSLGRIRSSPAGTRESAPAGPRGRARRRARCPPRP